MSFSLKKVMAKHKGRIFEKWIFDAHSPLLGNAAVSDINGDGIPEVVFGTKKGMIHCLDHEAKELWSFATGSELKPGDELFYDLEQVHAISSAPALVDINNDGKQEVIFGTEDGVMYALSHTGDLLWEVNIGGAIKATPKVVDANNDGSPEIIVTSTNKKLVMLNAQGKILVSFKTREGSEATPGVLRGENGAQSMIVFGLNDGTIHAINTQEKQLWTFKTEDRITAEPVFIKMKDELLIVVGSWDGSVYALTGEGELKWKFKTAGAIYHKVVVGDINNDGHREIVFGSCDNHVYALTLKGEKLWSYETDFWVMANPLLMDIDADGAVEVIAGSFDNNLYILEGAGSYELEYVPGLSGIIHQAGHYTDVLSSEPGERQGKRLWQYRTKGMIVGCSLIEEPHEHPRIIVNIKSGFVDALGHKD